MAVGIGFSGTGRITRARTRAFYWSEALASFALAAMLVACSSGKRAPGQRGDDGYAVGGAPLALAPAPAGLCQGGGADKKCGPEGCVQQPSAPQSSAAVPAASGAAPQMPSSSSGSALPMTAASPSGRPSGSAGGPAPSAPPAPPSTPPHGAQCTRSADAATPLDAGPDAAQCSDGAVGSAQAALIEDDVPGCAQADPGRATRLFLSADDSGSMAGPVIARRLIRGGQPVPAHVVRPWEFLNYYDFSFEPAAPGQVRIVPQLSSCPQNDRLSLQVALQAEARAEDERAPLTITFVLDTSGSMGATSVAGETPIVLERAAVLALAGRLREGDVVSMVTWDTSQREIMAGHAITGASDPVLVAAAAALAPGGGTDLHAGLTRGYELAKRFYDPARINRVILISDGIANAGVTDEMLIAQHADDEQGDAGIYLAGIGVGAGLNDTLMNAVTDAGRGAYVYLDSSAEANRMLGERYLQVVDLAARAVRLEVTLPYHLVLEKFFGEVASTDAQKVRPQHLAPNDAMLFFQVLRACDPSLLHGDDRIELRATWQTPFTREMREQTIDTTLNALAGDDEDLSKAAAIAGYAEALVTAATAVEAADKTAALEHALGDVRTAEHADSDPDLLEVGALLERYLQQFPASRAAGQR